MPREPPPSYREICATEAMTQGRVAASEVERHGPDVMTPRRQLVPHSSVQTVEGPLPAEAAAQLRVESLVASMTSASPSAPNSPATPAHRSPRPMKPPRRSMADVSHSSEPATSVASGVPTQPLPSASQPDRQWDVNAVASAGPGRRRCACGEIDMVTGEAWETSAEKTSRSTSDVSFEGSGISLRPRLSTLSSDIECDGVPPRRTLTVSNGSYRSRSSGVAATERDTFVVGENMSAAFPQAGHTSGSEYHGVQSSQAGYSITRTQAHSAMHPHPSSDGSVHIQRASVRLPYSPVSGPQPLSASSWPYERFRHPSPTVHEAEDSYSTLRRQLSHHDNAGTGGRDVPSPSNGVSPEQTEGGSEQGFQAGPASQDSASSVWWLVAAGAVHFAWKHRDRLRRAFLGTA